MSEDAEHVAAWLGWPVWGLAVAAIFLSYNVAGAAEVDAAWTGWLWGPWVVLALAANAAVARGLGVGGTDLRDAGTWLAWVAGLAVFQAVDLLAGWAPSPGGPNAEALVFCGAAAAALSTLERIRAARSLAPGLLAGALLVALAYGLDALVAGGALRGLVAAFAAALAFAVAGWAGLVLER